MYTYKRTSLYWSGKWSEEEDNLLRESYSRVSVSDLAQLLTRSEKATRTRLERLGCRLSTLKRNKPKPKIIRRKYLGWHRDSYGRKYVSVKGRGSVAEHRYLVEQKLGRKLARSEQVHHINCDKTDNGIGNLYLFTDVKSHLVCHRSLEKIIKPLMERGIIKFDSNTGEYKI